MSKIGVFWFFDGEVFGETTTLADAQQSVPGLLDSDSSCITQPTRKRLLSYWKIKPSVISNLKIVF
jgi:hypothetical protein